MDFRRKLLEKVKSNSVLYNHNHPLFWDQKAKDEIWSKIAKELKVDDDTARKTYRTLRDGYQRNRKTQKTIGSTRYRYNDILSFIVKNSNKIQSSAKPGRKDGPGNTELFRKYRTIPANDDDRALMEAIKCRPVLYNRDKVLGSIRAAIWDEIAENLNRTSK